MTDCQRELQRIPVPEKIYMLHLLSVPCTYVLFKGTFNGNYFYQLLEHLVRSNSTFFIQFSVVKSCSFIIDWSCWILYTLLKTIYLMKDIINFHGNWCHLQIPSDLNDALWPQNWIWILTLLCSGGCEVVLLVDLTPGEGDIPL